MGTLRVHRSAAVALIVMAAAAIPAVAQTRTGGYATATGAITSRPDDLVGSAAIGGQIGYRASTGLLVFGEYLYAGKDYYFYDNSTWKMAASWTDVPAGSTSRGDWLFYRERHAVGVSGGYSVPIERVGIFGAGGIMLNVVTLSDAAEVYPEFEDAATQSSIGESTVLFTTTIRGGVVFPAESPVAGYLSLMMQLEPTRQLGETRYLQRNTYFLFGVSVQTGPLTGGEE